MSRSVTPKEKRKKRFAREKFCELEINRRQSREREGKRGSFVRLNSIKLLFGQIYKCIKFYSLLFKLPAPLFIHPLLFESNCVYRLVIYIIHLISGKVINVTGLENYDIATGVRNIKFIPVVFHVLFPHYSSYYNVIKYTYVRIHLHIHVTSFSSLCYFFFSSTSFFFFPILPLSLSFAFSFRSRNA